MTPDEQANRRTATSSSASSPASVSWDPCSTASPPRRGTSSLLERRSEAAATSRSGSASLDAVTARRSNFRSVKVGGNHGAILRKDFPAIADAVREVAALDRSPSR
ncbi:hypothetical protein ACIP39_28090 [Streptomyces tibetensis]|uniref:hypothetical protein n=1 Tax=Streptomyces tibetensis TaxID=2382123 RepID=UPI00381175AA